MSGVFLSYRRDDTSYIAGRLHDGLAEVLKDQRIFRDIDDIRPGVDFSHQIDEVLRSCVALVALIGEHWLRMQERSGGRCLDSPDDWVRLEIATALRRGVLVIPVLVENAEMPVEADLPSDIRGLARRQAITLSDAGWDDGVRRLVQVLREAVEGSALVPGDPDATRACPKAPVPLPPLLPRVESLPLVGRTSELSQLATAYDEAASGLRKAVFLAGEPGCGKTRLAAEAATRAHGNGALVLAGRCDNGLAVPYQPFLEALRHFVDHSCDCHLVPRLGRWPGELTRLVPEIGSRVAALPPPLDSEPETERYQLFEAIASWLAAASTERPILLVLDDLQWATKPTVLLLRHVVRSHDTMRLLLLGTYRDTEVQGHYPLAELLDDLSDDVTVEELPVGGLEVGEVGDLVTTATSGRFTAARDWAKAIHADTRGNPLFVRELARYLVESSALGGVSAEPGAVLRLGIPEGVHEVVSRRLSRLSETTTTALTTAAIIGLHFEAAVLETAARLDEEALVHALEEATAARLIEEVPGAPTRYRFSHAVVRASVYERTTRLRRVILHRRVGEALESVHGSDVADLLPELARHFAEGADGGPDAKAFSYARRAGDQALIQLANDEAVLHYRSALALLRSGPTEGPSTAEYCDALTRLGEAEARAGEPSYRRTLIDAADLARRLDDRERLVQAALSLTRGRSSAVGEIDRERVRVLQTALDAIPAEDSAIRARLLAYQGVELTWSGDWDTRAALSDEALAIARRIGDPETLALVLHLRFMTLWAASTLAERLEIVAEVQELSARLSDPTVAFHCAYSGCHAALEAGDMDVADQRLASAQRLSEQLQQPLLEWRVLYTRGLRATIAGDFEEGERLAIESLTVGQRSGQPDAARAFSAQIFTVRLHQGRLEELVGMAERGFVQATDTGSLPWLSQIAQAVVYCETDRDRDAQRVFDAVLAKDLRDVPNDYGWLPVVALGGAVCSYLRDVERAELLYGLLEPYRNQFVCMGPAWFGSTAHYLALTAATVADFEAADRHFEAAADMHAKAKSPVWTAVTHLAWGEMLVARNVLPDPQRGRQLLKEAQHVAARLGMAGVEAKARNALASSAERSQ